MKKTNPREMRTLGILLGVLLAQAAVAAAVWWPDKATPAADAALITAAPRHIEAVTIERSGDTPDRVVLERVDDGWTVGPSDGFPAENDEVEALLDDLRSLEREPDPVASQRVSHAALGVSEAEFDRKVTLRTSDGAETWYLGSSSGNGVYARRDGEDNVYLARGADTADFATRRTAYVDPNVLDLSADDVASITVQNEHGAFTLHRAGGSWALDAVPEGREVEQSELGSLAREALSLRIAELTTTGADDVSDTEGARVTFSFADESDGPTGFIVGAAVESRRLVRIDGSAHAFLVSSSSVDELLDASLDTLTSPIEDETTTEPTSM